MAWCGERNILVELNEPHHWGMRDASDVVFVVSAYLSAYNARAFGVRDYIAQMMFNSPPGLSDKMDLAKMLTVLDLIAPLCAGVPLALTGSARESEASEGGPGMSDPLTDPTTLTHAVTTGVLDAPHLRINPFGCGQVVTRIDHLGACVAMDPATGQELLEQERIVAQGIQLE